MTTVESLERRVSSYLRKWLGLPKCLSSAALYGKTNTLQLPFKGLKEEFMVTRTREALQYRDSKDPKVATAGIEIRTGRKWDAKRELQIAEERLRHKAIVGTVAKGRSGLGYHPSIKIPNAGCKEYHQLLQGEVRAGMEESRLSTMVALGQQGAWTKWQDVVQRKILWADFWRPNFYSTTFLIQAVYDTLPSPANLNIWGIKENTSCPLCEGRGTLQHILSNCPKALGEGRYRWRHDQVLGVIAEILKTAIRTSVFDTNKKEVKFIKAGDKAPPQKKKNRTGKLSAAPDWQMLADLGKQLKFPIHIAATNLRPDIVIFSNQKKIIIMLELTVSWEENIETANERKREKYGDLVNECREQGWHATCEPIEVGARGFIGGSLCKTLSKLGFTGLNKKKAIQAIIKKTEDATRWLWIKRSEPWHK